MIIYLLIAATLVSTGSGFCTQFPIQRLETELGWGQMAVSSHPLLVTGVSDGSGRQHKEFDDDDNTDNVEKHLTQHVLNSTLLYYRLKWQ